jgi:hypothetical protein
VCTHVLWLMPFRCQTLVIICVYVLLALKIVMSALSTLFYSIYSFVLLCLAASRGNEVFLTMLSCWLRRLSFPRVWLYCWSIVLVADLFVFYYGFWMSMPLAGCCLATACYVFEPFDLLFCDVAQGWCNSHSFSNFIVSNFLSSSDVQYPFQLVP